MILRICAGPPLHIDKKVLVWVLPKNPFRNSTACHQNNLVSQKSHAFTSSQGDIVKLGLKNCLLSGAFIGTLPHFFDLFHFLLNYTEHFWSSGFNLTGLRLPNYARTSPYSGRVKRLVNPTLNYK